MRSVLPAYQPAGSKSVSTECSLCSRGRKEKLAYQKPDQIGRGETAKYMRYDLEIKTMNFLHLKLLEKA